MRVVSTKWKFEEEKITLVISDWEIILSALEWEVEILFISVMITIRVSDDEQQALLVNH